MPELLCQCSMLPSAFVLINTFLVIPGASIGRHLIFVMGELYFISWFRIESKLPVWVLKTLM